MVPRDQDGAAVHPVDDYLFDGWRDAGVDPTKPNIARVYDYWLGGRHNLVVDRELGNAMATLDPWIPTACKANRAFLGRAVGFLASQGIRQFLDIGSGIPTAGNVHEVVQATAPDARIVYVDRDPVAVAMGRKLLVGNDRAAVVQADIRDPQAILEHAAVAELIDFDEPVAIMLVAILHFVLDADEPYQIVRLLRDAAAPGSYLVLSHVTSQNNEAMAAAAERIYNSRAADGQARSREQIAGFFGDGDWELAAPGLVYAPQWRPRVPADVQQHSERFWFLVGVARKQDEQRRLDHWQDSCAS